MPTSYVLTGKQGQDPRFDELAYTANPEDYDPIKLSIEDILGSDNLVEHLTNIQLQCLSDKIQKGFRDDEQSMQEWLKYADEAMELAKLHREPKNTPWRGAPNIKYPMITTAVMHFTATTESEMVKNGKVAKYKIIGNDPNGVKYRRAQRICTHLNYQIMEEMAGWHDDRGKLNQQLAVVGTAFTKTYYDPINSEVVSTLIPYDQIFINNGVTHLDHAVRISQLIYLSSNEIIEHMRHGLFAEYNIRDFTKDDTDSQAQYHELIEQHCFLDLDNDGYDEPYIVTIHKTAGIILRIVPRFIESDIKRNAKGLIARITPQQYFTDYHFFPSPDGAFFSFGFGTLLLDMNASVNTILNMLIGAGYLANTQGGFLGKDLRIEREDLDIEPGEWVIAEGANGATIKDNVVPFSYKEPSQVLYQLLGTLLEASQSLTGTTDVLMGTADTTNASPNTIMQLTQQSYKVYSGALRRILRSWKKELNKICKLNSQYLDIEKYIQLLSPSQQDLQEMYNSYGQFADYSYEGLLDIIPVVDSNEATSTESMARTQMEVQIAAQLTQISPQDHIIDLRSIARNAFKAIESENLETIVLPPKDPNQPDPQMIMLQQKLEMENAKIKISAMEAQIKAQEQQAKAPTYQAAAYKNMIEAQATAVDSNISVEQAQFDKVLKVKETQLKAMDTAIKGAYLEVDRKQADTKAKQLNKSDKD